MKKCNLYLDFVNSDDFDENDSEAFKDVLAHTEQCTDCSFDRTTREKILFNLSEMTDSDYPENLHEIAINSIYESESKLSDKFDFIGSFFMKLLKPVELGLSFACIIMFLFLFQLNNNSDSNLTINENNKATNLQKFKIAEANDNINEEGLQKVSKEEVKEFLVKLEEFQRLHPESKTVIDRNRPQVILVGDRK